MKEKVFTVDLGNSIESTPIAVFVQKANEYKSDIFIGRPNRIVNAKSIMGVMSVDFQKGNELTLRVDGEDEDEAIEHLISYFESVR